MNYTSKYKQLKNIVIYNIYVIYNKYKYKYKYKYNYNYNYIILI